MRTPPQAGIRLSCACGPHRRCWVQAVLMRRTVLRRKRRCILPVLRMLCSPTLARVMRPLPTPTINKPDQKRPPNPCTPRAPRVPSASSVRLVLTSPSCSPNRSRPVSRCSPRSAWCIRPLRSLRWAISPGPSTRRPGHHQGRGGIRQHSPRRSQEQRRQ